MAIVDIASIGSGVTIRKKLNKTTVVFPLRPWAGANAFPLLQNGIYQMRPRPGGAICVREKFYTPAYRNGPAMVAARNKFAAAIAAWQALSLTEKMGYNRKASGRKMSGYNLFIRYYILST